MSRTEWNITRCRAKYKGHKEANYTFWIVDYFNEKYVIEKMSKIQPVPVKDIDNLFGFLNWHIIDMRNNGVVKTKYFRTEKEVASFIGELNKKGGE